MVLVIGIFAWIQPKHGAEMEGADLPMAVRVAD